MINQRVLLKTLSGKVLLPLSVIALMNIVIYFDYWTGTRLFSGKDFLTGFGPLLIFQSDCLQAHSLPLWNPFMNFGYPFVEHFSNSLFFPTHLVMGLVTGSGFEIIQREMLLWIIAGGFGVYLCVREFGSSFTAGIISAASFMFCGQLMALPQWHVLVYNAACFPYLILGYHRAAGKNDPLSLLSIAFICLSIFGGYVVSTVLGLYIFILYVIVDALLTKRILFSLKYLAIVLGASVLLTAPKLLPIYEAMEYGPRIKSYSAAASRDMFNIVNLYNFMSLLLPVKYYFSLYLGQIGITALFYGLLRRRLQVNAAALLALLTAWLLMVDSDGTISLLRSATMFLPFMKLVRNEWIEWFFPSIFCILYLSKYIDLFLSDSRNSRQGAATLLALGLLTAVYLGAFSTELYGRAYLTHIALILLWSAVIFLTPEGLTRKAAVVALLSVEFLLVFNRISVDEPPAYKGDRMRLAVVDQGSVSRSYREDNQVRNKFYAVSVQDRLRPSIDESRMRPYLISGLGGAPVINAYPEQYGNFIDSMNLKFFSGWWYNVQERFDFIKLKESPLLAEMDGQPLAAIYDRSGSSGFAGAATADKVTCSGFDFSITPVRPGIFLLHQMYDRRWTAFVDGREQTPVRINDYFMGVEVGPGSRKVEFRFSDRGFFRGAMASVFTMTCLVFILLFRKRLAALSA